MGRLSRIYTSHINTCHSPEQAYATTETCTFQNRVLTGHSINRGDISYGVKGLYLLTAGYSPPSPTQCRCSPLNEKRLVSSEGRPYLRGQLHPLPVRATILPSIHC